MHKLQRGEAKILGITMCLHAGRCEAVGPLKPRALHPELQHGGDARSEAEDGLRAGAVGLCSAGVRNMLDGTKHAGKPGNKPGMPVCRAGHPMLLGCAGRGPPCFSCSPARHC